ncbi:MAG: DUF559 domain-containing protein [Pseudomonadota bacterium]
MARPEATPFAQDHAKQLRQNMTEAEKAFWTMVRGGQLSGWHFRRQVPIGRYIADFACLKARLIVEIDGGQHSENELDMQRTNALKRLGFRVIRFWNNEVLENSQGVYHMLGEALEAAVAPPPKPSPAGEG